MIRGVFSIALLLAASRPLSAHEGAPLAPHDAWTAWTFDPWIVATLLVPLAVYIVGAPRIRVIRARQVFYFALGWITLALALVSPIHAIGEVLFSVHMVQHELMMVVAAPLLILGLPDLALLRSMPAPVRRPVARGLRVLDSGALAWGVHFAALWLWHLPALFQATLENPGIHALQHFSFLGSALWFWWVLLRSQIAHHRYGAALFSLFTTLLHTTFLGVLLTFSLTSWYPAYSNTESWGLTPLEDQILGGLIMWVPAGITYVAAALWLVAQLTRDTRPVVLRMQA